MDPGAPGAVGLYDRWHESIAEDENPSPTAPWHELVKPHLGDLRGLRVLEIGCGRGAFARYLAEAGADVVAADFSPSAVALTAQLLDGRGEARVADITDIPFPDASFDLVVSLETLEHVPDPSKGLRELVRVTRPGGRLIVTTPNYLSFVGLYRIFLRLTGRRYTELGQPINKPLLLPARVLRLRRLGCRVDVVDGAGQCVPLPKARASACRCRSSAPSTSAGSTTRTRSRSGSRTTASPSRPGAERWTGATGRGSSGSKAFAGSRRRASSSTTCGCTARRAARPSTSARCRRCSRTCSRA
jgi:SAM-dependent methyltransferase